MDALAAECGLFPGQKLADALALEPNLVTADADPEGDLKALQALADWCVRFSPAVALDAPDGLFLDVTSAGRLWGGEAALIEDLTTRLAENDIPALAAIADTAGCAWALARYGDSRTVAESGTEREALEPLPVEALRLNPEASAALRRVGLKTVGAVLAAPRPTLTPRFGPELLLRLDQALGLTEEALRFRRLPTPFFERLAFFEPLSAPEDLFRVTSDLCERMGKRLADANKGARRFEAVFHRLDGKAFPVRIGTSLPSREASRLAKLFAPKLDVVDPGFGIEAVTLTAHRVEPLAPVQARLAGEADADVEASLAALADRLSNRLGEARVWRADPQARWVPEKAVARRGPLGPPPVEPGWDPERPRPVRLFRRPEPAEAVMAEVPDDPPVAFTWRGRRHRVRKAEGPERIAQEWWRKPVEEALDDAGVPRVRDYYRVEDEEGARFWLFRLGLYDGPRPVRWYVHGLFG